MSTIAQLQKEANKAPKFVLVTNEFKDPIYIADKKLSGGLEITENIKEACTFAVGYDDEKMKLRAWQLSTGYKLEVKYL